MSPLAIPTVALPGVKQASSPLILGVAEYGATVSQEDSFRLLDCYAEAGGNHVDTAHIYAAWIPGCVGSSERTLGRWLHSRGMVGKMIIATKGAHFALDGVHAPRVRPDCIHTDVSESLERLGVAHVELYYLHRDDPSVPVEPLLAALEEEVARGRIGAYACSNWTVPRLREAAAVAKANGWRGFSAHQAQWSLATVPAAGGGGTRAMDEELRAWHRDSGLPFAAYSSQANGFFARTWTWPNPDLSGRNAKVKQFATETNIRRALRVSARAAARGVSANQLALAWLLNQAHPTLAVIGGKTVAQVSDSLGALSIRLSTSELADLEHPER
jgi:aryl-alcohol dehydrogenase-like predicted oxidoreductase